ncbi:MAG: hypothetical protein AAB066_02550 [Candidatus Margulisiibacteriota bacterium]
MKKRENLMLTGLIAVTLILGHTLLVWAQDHEGSPHIQLDVAQESQSSEPDHHALVHPFLTHMGLPDGPGESSFRGNFLRQVEDGVSQGDFGFHIEAGVADGIGIHLRNDAVSANARTELMVQAAVWRDSTNLSGIAVFGEAEFATGATAERRITWLYGISGRWVMLPILSLDADIHHNPLDSMVEWETAAVYRLTETLFPILEIRGESGNSTSIVNMLTALKIKTAENMAIGIGIQYPMSTTKEFDSQLLIQVDMGFH